MTRMPYRSTKYHAVKTEVDGIKFDSKKEAKRYQELKLLEKAKVIKDLRLQVPFTLIEKSEHGRAIRYIADFVYYDNEKGKEIIEDTKGFRTDVYKLKARMMAEQGHKIYEL